MSAVGPAVCHDDHCITCSDEGIVMRVTGLAGEGTALCTDPQGGAQEVAVDLVGDVAPGDALLVHAGVALAHLGRAA